MFSVKPLTGACAESWSAAQVLAVKRSKALLLKYAEEVC